MEAVKYYIDGIDIKEQFGVCVSDSEGIVDLPKLKKPMEFSWDNYHGSSVDLEHKFYESREIKLTCFIVANNRIEFITRIQSFADILNKKGSRRLMISVNPTRPLLYEVYCKDEISIKKKWSESTMVGTFTLKLTEPEPVKKVLLFVRSDESTTCTITLTTTKLVNVYWGDGSVDFDVYGSSKTISHHYLTNGEYYPVVTGDIDEITEFTSNAITIWNKLQ